MPAVGKTNTLPLLANVLIQTTGSGLRLTCSDMETALVTECGAAVLSPGEITIEVKRLSEIVKSLPLETAHFRRLENNWIEITSGKAYFKIVGLSTDGFPGIPEINKGFRFEISGPVLKRMIDDTFFSIATDDSRYGLNGAFLATAPDHDAMPGMAGKLVIVSTDGHRLSISAAKVDGVESDVVDKGMLLSRKGLAALKGMCGDDVVTCHVSETACLFTVGVDSLYSRNLEGDFPDYTQVMPTSHQRSVEVDKIDLSRALKRVGLLASHKTNSVRLTVDGGLTISASNPDAGEAREEIEADTKGDKLAIGVNASYLLDALGAVSSGRVRLEFGDSISPIKVVDTERTGAVWVCMPMRLSD